MRLNQLLCEKNIQYRQSDTYLLFAKYRDKGYAQSRPYTHTDRLGNQQTRQHLYWTKRGKEFIISLFK
jgi:phage antirepressor YoqD-like protein